jgi:hypothetical protein
MSEYRRPRDLAEAEAAARAGVLEGQKAGTSIWEPCDANLGDDDFWCANPASERHRVPVSFSAPYIEKHLPVDRVAAPEGVTVIGWTEPTDDEPRQLPIVWGNDIPDEGWERNGYGDPPGHFRTYGEPRGDASYIIRPIPSPPVPETERVRLDQIVGRRLPGKSWAVTEFGFDPMDGYVAQGHPSDDDLHPVAPFYVDADGYVSVLPLDGTDGD